MGALDFVTTEKLRLTEATSIGFGQAIVSTAKAGRLLQEALGDDAPTFSQTELELTVNDRAIAPNTPETFAALTKDIASSATTILGHSQFTLTHHDDPRRLFSVTVATGKPFDLAKLT